MGADHTTEQASRIRRLVLLGAIERARENSFTLDQSQTVAMIAEFLLAYPVPILLKHSVNPISGFGKHATLGATR